MIEIYSLKKEAEVYLVIYRRKCFDLPFAPTFLQLVAFYLSLLKIPFGLFSSHLLSLAVLTVVFSPSPSHVVVEHSLPVDRIKLILIFIYLHVSKKNNFTFFISYVFIYINIIFCTITCRI